MNKKNILIIAAIVCVAYICMFSLIKFVQYNYDKNQNQTEVINNKTEDNVDNDIKNSKSDDKILKQKQNADMKQKSEESSEKEQTIETIQDSLSYSLPLSLIAESAKLPSYIKNSIYKLAENSNIYMVNKCGDKLLIITDNPANIRHNIEFTEISLLNGHQIQTTLGYSGKMKDTENDIWEYNEETKQPLRHTKYNKDGDMEFVEVWNYEPENPIKYEMKDANGKVLSMRKETFPDGSNLSVEHILYDKDGNTKMNVSATYDGQDIKRFTYYNADKLSESGSMFSEYADGFKTKEVIYSSDYKVKNTYTADYTDGTRNDIIKWDSENKEVAKFVPAESL